jgi:hypothetical protein
MQRGIGFAASLEWPRGLIVRADRVRFPFARLQIGFCIESFLREVRSPAFGSKAHPPASPATQWRATLALESRDGSRTARIYTDNFYPCE